MSSSVTSAYRQDDLDKRDPIIDAMDMCMYYGKCSEKASVHIKDKRYLVECWRYRNEMAFRFHELGSFTVRDFYLDGYGNGYLEVDGVIVPTRKSKYHKYVDELLATKRRAN
jgi:hypothetical protein